MPQDPIVPTVPLATVSPSTAQSVLAFLDFPGAADYSQSVLKVNEFPTNP